MAAISSRAIEALDARAAAGDEASKVGADALRRLAKLGRPRLADRDALLQMVDMISTGKARSVREAAKHVAGTMPVKHSEDSVVKRLCRKYPDAQKYMCHDT